MLWFSTLIIAYLSIFLKIIMGFFFFKRVWERKVNFGYVKQQKWVFFCDLKGSF